MVSKKLYWQATIVAALEAAGLSPGNYKLNVSAKVTWAGVVPDAARLGKLPALMDYVFKDDVAFRAELERQWNRRRRKASLV